MRRSTVLDYDIKGDEQDILQKVDSVSLEKVKSYGGREETGEDSIEWKNKLCEGGRAVRDNLR